MTNRMKFVPKGWGYELWIVNSDLYCGKLLRFEEGKRCALHYHARKDETFFVSRGLVAIHYCKSLTEYVALAREQKPMLLKILAGGQPFYVSPGMVHMIEARTLSDIFEFSTHHEDGDSFFVQKGDELDWGEGQVVDDIRMLKPVFGTTS